MNNSEKQVLDSEHSHSENYRTAYKNADEDPDGLRAVATANNREYDFLARMLKRFQKRSQSISNKELCE